MELLKFTEPQLRKVPTSFDFSTGNAQELADTLWTRCRELHGLGLSANQVGIDARVFVMGVNPESRKDVFNPKIIEVSKETILAKEGCLSYPGLWLTVRRPETITVSYQNVLGEFVIDKLSGLPSRIFQHEFDHMEGLNFTDYVSEMKMKMALKSLEKRAKKYVRKYVEQHV